MSSRIIVLPEVAGFEHVGGLHQEILEALESGDAIEIDLRTTCEIDASILQLLIALQKTGRSRGLGVEIQGWTTHLTKAMRNSGAEYLTSETPSEPSNIDSSSTT